MKGAANIPVAELCREYAAALDRLRRHKRGMRETRCVERDDPCWAESDPLDMCDQCLRRQVEYYFRGVAVKDVARLRRAIERWAQQKSQS